MSVFDQHTRSQYVEGLRRFLRRNKRRFLQEAGLVPGAPRTGRAPRYEDEAVRQLELKANQKAARAEAADTTLDERIRLARDYQFMTDADVGRACGLTREMARRWAAGLNVPPDLEKLAQVLNAPVEWLKTGDRLALPASSHLGLRVGEEALSERERLFSLTQQVLGELDDLEDSEYVQAFIEWAVFDKPALAAAARRCGGRWQFLEGQLHFVPWAPLQERELTRRFWSDEVEAIIAEELARPGQSVYRAWDEMRKRCEAFGLTEDDYPRRVSLFKRVEKQRERAEQFGVDLNAMIAAAVTRFEQGGLKKAA